MTPLERKIAELSAAMEARQVEIDQLLSNDDATAEDIERASGLLDEQEGDAASRSEKVSLLERQVAAAKIFADPTIPKFAAVDFSHLKQDKEVDPIRSSATEVRDAALRIVEEAHWLDSRQQDAADKLLRRSTSHTDGELIARRTVATERPAYRSAFAKFVAGRGNEFSDEERQAVAEFRAGVAGSMDTSGGFGVPVTIDPTILITDGYNGPGILKHCRIENVTTDAWRGVSAANTAWSFDAESVDGAIVEVSEDGPTMAQPTVDVHMAQAFIPYSIRAGQDYPGLAAELGRLVNDGYLELMSQVLAVGTGSDQPWGAFVTTMTTTTVTTDNTFGAPDVDLTWAALGERFRGKAVWFMNVDVENDIRGFGSGTATSRFTVDQTREGISLLNGRPVVLSDYAPTWAGTDGAAILVLGDFSNYVVAQRVGMTVEHVPHVFGATTGRPTGQRGLYAYARVGADKVVQNAFRRLKNITT